MFSYEIILSFTQPFRSPCVAAHMAIAARLASGPQMDKAAREQAELLTSSTPASSALAAALGANPAELKHDWHLVGPELTREEFAYLV